MKEFKEKLQELIKEHNNISPENLEKELDNMNLFVSANAIRGYLKGKFPKNMEYYFNLAKYFNVSPLYLIDNNIENKESIENIQVGQQLLLSDKSIDNIKKSPMKSKNKLIEGDFFKKTSFFIEMNQDLKEFKEKLDNYNKLNVTYNQKITNIEQIQKLCTDFHTKYHSFGFPLDYFNGIEQWNILERYKNEINETKDGFDMFYVIAIDTITHSIEKSIKIIHSEMKDCFVYFIDSL